MNISRDSKLNLRSEPWFKQRSFDFTLIENPVITSLNGEETKKFFRHKTSFGCLGNRLKSQIISHDLSSLCYYIAK